MPAQEGQAVSLFGVVLADAELRAEVEQEYGKLLASDACAVVFVREKMLGWGDDYGTFHALPQFTGKLSSDQRAMLEELLDGVSGLFEAVGA